MPINTLPPLNAQTVDSTVPQVFNCRGATSLQITISFPTIGVSSGVYLAFARSINGLTQGFGPEEFHGFELLNINDEAIDAVQYRAAVSGGSAVLTIIPSSA